MNRITIFRDNQGKLVFTRERLSKRPSGNAQQRKKQIRHGWQPSWVTSERARPLSLDAVNVDGFVFIDIKPESEVI